MPGRKIRVLVVDDSLVSREGISRGLAADPDIEVVAKAVNPFDARDKILEFEPDVMTCDVEMPMMNGIEFIRRLLPQYPLRVIVVSSVSSAVFDAMRAGAVDFVAKPNMRTANGYEGFIHELITKVKIAARAKLTSSAGSVPHPIEHSQATLSTDKVVAIGASTGGTEAISHILSSLPAVIAPILVVQHIPPEFSRMFAERMDSSTRLHVVEARDGDYLEPGKVLVAPGGRQMRVRKAGANLRVEVFDGERVNGHSPSVDVLFESVAREAKDRAIGVILTGMGYDGARGLLAMRRKGARTIGQDERTSVVYGMPKVAHEIGAVERKLALSAIPTVLIELLQ